MEEKLKSISKTIPWSLALKAAAFGLGWYILPFWSFLLLGLGMYFIPLFQPVRLLLPFLLAVSFAAVLPYSPWAAVMLGVIFFFILGIKDLIFIRRGAAYETLVFLLLFLIFLNYFARFSVWNDWAGLALGILAAAASAFLLRGFILYRVPAAGEWTRRKRFLLFSLAGLLLWQWQTVLLFLPLNFFYQTAILFLGAVALIELFLAYAQEELTKRKILVHFSFFFVLSSFILAANSWRI